ncbi:MAG: lectin like domain-containing protein [Bacteroidales bacterium]|nr:lectin like domain-containing protein [Bacteroidales bacterium]
MKNPLILAVAMVLLFASQQAFAQTEAKPKQLPARFDLRVEGRPEGGWTRPARSQGPFNNCWAHAAMASVESSIWMTTGKDLSLSPWHMTFVSHRGYQAPNMSYPGFHSISGVRPLCPINPGGTSRKSIATLSLVGAVLEEHSPFNPPGYDRMTPDETMWPTTQEPIQAIVTHAYILGRIGVNPNVTRDLIKELIMTYGALSVSYFHSVSQPRNPDGSHQWNRETAAYHFTGNRASNHTGNLVGWDDNFSRKNFASQPDEDGAWIVRNSHGSTWGDGTGHYYVSWATPWGTTGPVVYRATIDLPDKIYHHDQLGRLAHEGADFTNGFAGATYMANIFTAAGDHIITAIAYFTDSWDAPYEIIIKTAVGADPSIGTRAWTQPQTGTLRFPGYHTITLDNPVKVAAGERFAVIVKNTEPNRVGNNKIPVSFATQGTNTRRITAEPGHGFVSVNGTTWGDIAIVGAPDPDSNTGLRNIALRAIAVKK